MKASELIELIKQNIVEHGDLEVEMDEGTSVGIWVLEDEDSGKKVFIL